MNTREAAKRWRCSEKTVREYCKTGMIPFAEKINGKWYVPDEMRALPPVTLNRAIYLLACIEDNVLPDVSRYWSEEKLLNSLLYLSDMRFIIGYEGHSSLEEAAKQCRVSKLGKKLIESSTNGNEIEAGGDIGIKAGIESGLPSAVMTLTGSAKVKRKD